MFIYLQTIFYKQASISIYVGDIKPGSSKKIGLLHGNKTEKNVLFEYFDKM